MTLVQVLIAQTFLVLAISFEYGFVAAIACVVSIELGLFLNKGVAELTPASKDFIVVDFNSRIIITPKSVTMPDRVVVFRDGTKFDFIRDNKIIDDDPRINVFDRGAEA